MFTDLLILILVVVLCGEHIYRNFYMRARLLKSEQDIIEPQKRLEELEGACIYLDLKRKGTI